MKKTVLSAAAAAVLLLSACGNSSTESSSGSVSKANDSVAENTASSQAASEGTETSQAESTGDPSGENEPISDYLDEEEVFKYTAENGRIKVWLPTKITQSNWQNWEENEYETVTYDERGLPVRWDHYGEYWSGDKGGREYGVKNSFIYSFNDDYTLRSLTYEHRDENYTEPLSEDSTWRFKVAAGKAEKTETHLGSPVEYTDNGLVKQFRLYEEKTVTIEYNEQNRPVSIFTASQSDDKQYTGGSLTILNYNDDGAVSHAEHIANAFPTKEDFNNDPYKSSSSMEEYNGYYVDKNTLDSRTCYDFTYDANGRVVKESKGICELEIEYKEYEIDESHWEVYRDTCLYTLIDPRNKEGNLGGSTAYENADNIYSYINNGCYQNYLHHYLQEKH
ncbi:MAG: hypothetical protein IKN17_11975 [Ruminococcus sp.]|nr:hypothetical protein [Ruminococcus sp.]